MRIFNSKKPSAWGLDIGEKQLKLVALIPDASSYRLTHYNTIDLDENEIVKGEVSDSDKLTEKIQKLIANATGEKRLKTQFVHACIPDTQTFVKLIDIPDMTDEEIPEAIKWASEHHIPLAADDMYLDWQIVHHDPQNKKITVLIGAVPKTTTDKYTQAIKNADLVPMSLDVEATAIIRALEPSFTTKEKAGSAILDLGQTHTSLIVIAHETIQFISNIPFSGDEATNLLTEKLNITTQEAEKAKKICGLDNPECEDALKKILNDKLNTTVKKIKAAFEYYENESKNPIKIQNIILSGGGAYMSGLSNFLEKELDIKITLGQPEKHISNSSEQFPVNSSLKYATAIGLALKAYL